MGFIAFLILGLVAGTIAKAVLPGRQGGGWLATLAVGVVGAFVGGALGSLIFDVPLGDIASISTWLLAIGGSIIVLLVYGALTRRRRS